MLPGAHEAEHPLNQQHGDPGLVGRERTAGEVVLAAWVEEQLPG